MSAYTAGMDSPNEFDGAFKKKAPARAPRRRRPVDDDEAEPVSACTSVVRGSRPTSLQPLSAIVALRAFAGGSHSEWGQEVGLG